MASYFRQVPNFEYINRINDEQYISQYTPVKNFFKRGKLRDDIFKNLTFFEKYSIIGDERPDNVAYKFYNDSTLDWVVLLSNNILNIQSEWPLTQDDFDRIMLKKYGTYEELYSGIHHYETIEIKSSLNITVLSGGIKISPTWKTNGNFLEINNSKIEEIYSGNKITSSNTITVELKNGIPGLTVGSQVTINNVSEPEYNGKQIIEQILTKGESNIKRFTYKIQSTPVVTTPSFTSPNAGEVLFKIPENINSIFIESNPGQDTFSLNYVADSITVFINGTELSSNSFTATNGNSIILDTPCSGGEVVEIRSSQQIITPNSYYYEYWDDGLGYSVQVPSTSFVKEVTNYEYESSLEEKKRNIYVLKPRYLNVVFNDMEEIMRYKEGSTQYLNATLKRSDNIRLYE